MSKNGVDHIILGPKTEALDCDVRRVVASVDFDDKHISQQP